MVEKRIELRTIRERTRIDFPIWNLDFSLNFQKKKTFSEGIMTN